MRCVNSINILDSSKRAIDYWCDFTPEEKLYWSEYFQLRKFQPDMLLSFDHYYHHYSYHLTNEDITRVVFCIAVEILRYHHNNNMNRVFLANSGGLDSASICGLLSKSKQLGDDIGMPFDIISYGLPIMSNSDHNIRATETVAIFGIKHLTVDGLDAIFEDLKESVSGLAKQFEFSEDELKRGLGNIKARIRMIINFFGTTKAGAYVISTDNLSELYMAFWTLMGDVGAFGPIQNILKGLELPSIAYALGVPDATLGAKPTDGLHVHKSLDEDEGGDTDAFRGVYYPHMDAIICHGVANGLKLDSTEFVNVDADLIQSKSANQETVDFLVKQMVSPASVWKRTKGSIGSAISRDELGLLPLPNIDKLL